MPTASSKASAWSTASCVNPESGDYWIIDYRIFKPDGDGKTKLDHVRDMLTNAIADKRLPFTTVLMDGLSI